MKANKALKRLAKVEALMSNVSERYSAPAPHLRKVLQEAKAAVARAREAVSLQVSSGTKAAASKANRAAKKATPVQKKASVKNAVATAKRAKKPRPFKKDAKTRAANKTVPPAAQATTTAAAQ